MLLFFVVGTVKMQENSFLQSPGKTNKQNNKINSDRGIEKDSKRVTRKI